MPFPMAGDDKDQLGGQPALRGDAALRNDASLRGDQSTLLRRPGARRDPARDQRPVPVRAEPGEQLAELPVRDAPRSPLRHPRTEQPRSLTGKRVHRIMVR